LTEWIIFDIYRVTFFDIGCAVQILERFARRRLDKFAIPVASRGEIFTTI